MGIEATGSIEWFLELMEELGSECQVGHAAKIRAAEPRKQKHDRRDAALVLQLLVENRFPSIWMPSREQRDVRSLILYRHQWVEMFSTGMWEEEFPIASLIRSLRIGAVPGSGHWRGQIGQLGVLDQRYLDGWGFMTCDKANRRLSDRWPKAKLAGPIQS